MAIRRVEKWLERGARTRLLPKALKAHELRVAGKTAKQIAGELGVTDRTVRNYLRTLRSQIDLRGRAIVDGDGIACIETDGIKLPLLAIRIACPACGTPIYGMATRADAEFIVNCPLCKRPREGAVTDQRPLRYEEARAWLSAGQEERSGLFLQAEGER